MDVVTPDAVDVPVDALVDPVVVDESLAAHEAQFRARSEPASTPTPPEPVAPVVEAPKERGQRSQKQQARAEDVPRIRELTAKWRDEERKRTDLEQRLASYEAQARATTAPLGAARPSIEDFAQADDPYGAHLIATARWEARQEQAQLRAQWEQEQAQTQARQRDETALSTFAERLQSFVETTPDYGTKIDAIKDEQPPELLLRALLEDDNGPAMIYALAENDALRAELHLVTDGKAVNPANVATVRRLLHARTAAAATGSAAPIPRSFAPRPPNPVRTGPLTPTFDLPGDDGSLADHERAYGARRRR